MLESQQSRSNLDQDWLRGMEIVSDGMLAARITAVSVKSGSKLAERYGDSNSMPETQQSWSNLDKNWKKYWHTTSRYARITRPSVKSGTKLAEQY